MRSMLGLKFDQALVTPEITVFVVDQPFACKTDTLAILCGHKLQPRTIINGTPLCRKPRHRRGPQAKQFSKPPTHPTAMAKSGHQVPVLIFREIVDYERYIRTAFECSLPDNNQPLSVVNLPANFQTLSCQQYIPV